MRAACLLGLAAAALTAACQAGGGFVLVKGYYAATVMPDGSVIERMSPFPAPDTAMELLPEGRAVCAALRLRAGQCDGPAVLDRAARQTDRSLWYDRLSYGMGSPPENCREPHAFARFDTETGEKGTAFLCLAPDADDTVTAGELATVAATAARYNAITTPTLSDAMAAAELRRLLARGARDTSP